MRKQLSRLFLLLFWISWLTPSLFAHTGDPNRHQHQPYNIYFNDTGDPNYARILSPGMLIHRRGTCPPVPSCSAGNVGEIFVCTDSAATYVCRNGSAWELAAGGGGGGASNLDGLTDVIITSPVTGQILRYNGSAWVDYAPPLEVWASDFGAVFDGVTDDRAAIQAAIDYLATLTAPGAGGGVDNGSGGVVWGSYGTARIGAPLIVKNRVRFRGQGALATNIEPTDSFVFNGTTDALVQLGPVGTTVNYQLMRVEDMTLHCRQKTGCIGLYSDSLNEESGAYRVSIRQTVYKGIFFDGSSVEGGSGTCRNIWLQSIQIGTLHTDAIGLHLKGCSERNTVVDITTSGAFDPGGGPVATGGTGILVEGGSPLTIIGAHAEYHDIGFDFTSTAEVTLHNPTGSSNIVAMMQFQGDRQGAFDISQVGSAPIIIDASGCTGHTNPIFTFDGSYYYIGALHSATCTVHTDMVGTVAGLPTARAEQLSSKELIRKHMWGGMTFLRLLLDTAGTVDGTLYANRANYWKFNDAAISVTSITTDSADQGRPLLITSAVAGTTLVDGAGTLNLVSDWISAGAEDYIFLLGNGGAYSEVARAFPAQGSSFTTVGTATADTSTDSLAINDSVSIDFTTANDPETFTGAFSYTSTLAGNPALNVDECVFSTDGSGGGLICEGLAADTTEGLFSWPVSGGDKTITFPNVTGDFVTTQQVTGDGTLTTGGTLEVTQADALETNPTDCSANQWATAIDASGNLACAAISGGAGITDGTVVVGDLAASVAYFSTFGTAVADAPGDSIAVNDSLSIDFTTGNDPETFTGAFTYTATLAGNPALNAEECVFSTDGAGGGILCEGSTANASEGLLLWNPTSDVTLTLPNQTGTLVTVLDLTNGNVIPLVSSAASALESDPTDCAANQWAHTISAAGNLTCSTISGGAGISDGTVAAADLTTSMVYSGAWDFSGQVEMPNSTTPPSGDCDSAGEAGRLYMDSDATGPMAILVCRGTAGWGPMGPAPAKVVTVCDRGCDAVSPCAADCTSASSTCAAGTGGALVTALSPTASAPVVLDIREPKTYTDGCIRFDDVSGVTVRGAGWETKIRPPVTLQSSIVAGAISWQNSAGTSEHSDFAVENLTVHSDDCSGGNVSAAAIQIGTEADEETISTAARWTNFRAKNVRLIGCGQGIDLSGEYNANTIDNLPYFEVSDSYITGGNQGISVSGFIDRRSAITNVIREVFTNGCDDSETTNVSLGTITGSPTTTTMELASAPNRDGWGDGRKLTLSGASCPAGILSDPSRDIDYTDDGASNPTVKVTRAFGATPDSNCTWTVAPRAMRLEAFCTDKNWPELLADPDPTVANLGNTYPIYIGADGNGSLSQSNNDGTGLTIEGGIGRAFINNAQDNGRKHGPGVLSKDNTMERVVVSGGISYGSIGYEEGIAGVACSIATNTHLHYPHNLENMLLLNHPTVWQEGGRNCDIFTFTGANSTQNILSVNSPSSVTYAAATINGVTRNARVWDSYPEIAGGATDRYIYVNSFNVNSRAFQAGQAGDTSAVRPTGMPAYESHITIPLTPTTSAAGLIVGTTNQCQAYPVEFSTVGRVNRVRWVNDATSTGDSDSQAFCLYSADGQQLIMKAENLTGVAGTQLVDLAAADDFTIAPGSYVFSWCTEGTGVIISGWTTGNRTFGVTTTGVGDGTVCPATATITESNWTVPKRPEFSFYAN